VVKEAAVLKIRLVGLVCALSLLSMPAVSMAQATGQDAAPAPEPEQAQQPQNQQQAQPPASPRPTVVADYSDAYVTRRKIHFYASLATAPLFVSQYIVGEKLDDDGGNRGLHSALGVGIGSLFAVNTVTGVWNLWEARHDPNGRRRRLIHGLTMLGADVGFVATGLLAPDNDDGGHSDSSTHRTLAITSMGVAAGSYVYMLLTR
jgi:hypothetical protein